MGKNCGKVKARKCIPYNKVTYEKSLHRGSLLIKKTEPACVTLICLQEINSGVNLTHSNSNVYAVTLLGQVFSQYTKKKKKEIFLTNSSKRQPICDSGFGFLLLVEMTLNKNLWEF